MRKAYLRKVACLLALDQHLHGSDEHGVDVECELVSLKHVPVRVHLRPFELKLSARRRTHPRRAFSMRRPKYCPRALWLAREAESPKCRPRMRSERAPATLGRPAGSRKKLYRLGTAGLSYVPRTARNRAAIRGQIRGKTLKPSRNPRNASAILKRAVLELQPTE